MYSLLVMGQCKIVKFSGRGDFVKVHWKNLNALLVIIGKGEKEGNKKYSQLLASLCRTQETQATKNRLLNEMEDQLSSLNPGDQYVLNVFGRGLSFV